MGFFFSDGAFAFCFYQLRFVFTDDRILVLAFILWLWRILRVKDLALVAILSGGLE